MKIKTTLALAFGFTMALAACPLHAQVTVHDVVFKVGSGGSIDWFEIDNPSVQGVLTVTNAPYPSSDGLNAAVVDISRNRLIFDDDTNLNSVSGYAISFSGLQLVQNGSTPVTVSSLGLWQGGAATAGYRASTQQVIYTVNGTDDVRRLNFDSSGAISGYTDLGSFTGSNLTTYMTRGDLDFAADGSLWVSGDNQNGVSKLWNFTSSNLALISFVPTPDVFNGITFDSTGTTLYAYDDVTDQYGIVNTTTGGFQTVLATDPTRFGDLGDFAQGVETIVSVPEPTTILMAGVVLIGLCHTRRNRAVVLDPVTGD